MGFWQFMLSSWLGMRVFIWFYMGFSILFWIGVLIYVLREQIRKRYYELRYPERLVKIVMHYESGYFQNYYRLIPDVDHFTIGKKIYYYTDEQILKENDFFSKEYKGKEFVTIEGKHFLLNKQLGIKNRWSKYPEIHYFFNCPSPISFEYDKSEIALTSMQMLKFKENDLFVKLLKLGENTSLIIFILIICGINVIVTLFLLAKNMGWIK